MTKTMNNANGNKMKWWWWNNAKWNNKQKTTYNINTIKCDWQQSKTNNKEQVCIHKEDGTMQMEIKCSNKDEEEECYNVNDVLLHKYNETSPKHALGWHLCG